MARIGDADIAQSPTLSTFSIVAYDPTNAQWGVGVQSKFPAVGAIVPWARAGAGVVATQGRGNVAFGPLGLEMLSKGMGAEETLDRLLSGDAGRDERQVGLIDAHGTPAVFTGVACQKWAGSLTGAHYAVQGNILVSGATVEAMADAFERSDGELSHRLVTALSAGQRAGGDRRGRQAAALLVVGKEGVYGGDDDRCVDLRVDDAPRPIERLRELLELHSLVFQRPSADDWVAVQGQIGRQFQSILRRAGRYEGPITGDADSYTLHALSALMAAENMAGRFRESQGLIDRRAAAFLLERLGPKVRHGGDQEDDVATAPPGACRAGGG